METKTCVSCKEQIKKEATICPYCRGADPKDPGTIIVGIVILVLIAISVIRASAGI